MILLPKSLKSDTSYDTLVKTTQLNSTETKGLSGPNWSCRPYFAYPCFNWSTKLKNCTQKKAENCNSELIIFFRTEPDGRSCLAMNGNSCPWHRGKVIGGSSTINGMLYVRGSREDFDEWYRLGNPGKKITNYSIVIL